MPQPPRHALHALAAGLLLVTAPPAPSHAQQAGPDNAPAAAQRPPHDWVFNGRGQKTDQTHYADAARDDKLYPININNNWGLMNQDGEVVVFPRFDWTGYSFEGYTRYMVNGKTGYLRADPADDSDPDEFFLIAQFDYADRFADGAAVVMNQGRWGMIDRAGRALVPMAYDRVLRMQDGFAAVQKDGLCGFVNRAGRLKVPLQFKRVRSFHNGYAAVQLPNDQWGYIDKRGELVWRDRSGRVTMLGDFHQQYARVQGQTPDGEKRWGYISKAFRFSVDPVYEDARDFHNGLAAVMLGGKWGFIYPNGRWAIEPRYDRADDFDDAEHSGDFDDAGRQDNTRPDRDPQTAGLYAMVQRDGRWGYIDRTGREVLVPQFEQARPFFRGLARVSRGNSFAYITERGQVRFDPLITMKLGLVNVSSREDSRVVAARTVNTHLGTVGGLERISIPGGIGIANKVIYPPPPREPAAVPYPPEHEYGEMLPVED